MINIDTKKDVGVSTLVHPKSQALALPTLKG